VGTPEGVIFGSKERMWLAESDEIVVVIEGLGRLQNRFAKGD
jgi:2-keto-4-pentenoate hydratase/2-oxohepta-3-ene-1,7-dioic acid hydratase in catechol pathway